MPNDEERERKRTYAREYARRRAVEDPEFAAKRMENNRRFYERRKLDPEFVARLREKNSEANRRRAVARKAKNPEIRRGSLPGFDAGVGQAVRTARKAARLSLDEVATHLEVSRTQAAKYERGETVITAGLLYRLAALLHVSVDALFGMEKEEISMHPTSSAETAAVVEAYLAIPDAEVRRRLLYLLVRMAEVSTEKAKREQMAHSGS